MHHSMTASVPAPWLAPLLCVCVCVSGSRSVWAGSSVRCICVYLHLCTQPTVHLECLVRSPSLAGKQMEETRAPCSTKLGMRPGNSLPFKYSHRLPTPSNCFPQNAAPCWLERSPFLRCRRRKRRRRKKTQPKICSIE